MQFLDMLASATIYWQEYTKYSSTVSGRGPGLMIDRDAEGLYLPSVDV